MRLHDFPKFYACYLLRSIQLPLSSRATYIGSTPNPIRRIRQHNGILTAGARRTVSKRPWAMQMIVHGFPSSSAALQFEWAWQNPHKSRHLRDNGVRIFGNCGTRRIDKLIRIVRTMITRNPFNAWPLHVKLFTKEAVEFWEAASTAKHAPAMPPGFTCSIELEGVDGNSGRSGSGRTGPIDISDTEFTNAHLAKHISLLATQRRLECNICHKPMHSYATEPLETSLCPSLHCTSVTHLSCLSQYFLQSQAIKRPKQNISELIPRGGDCKSCGNYILWGDVIRGSYRRFRAMQKAEDGGDNIVEDDLFVSDEDELSEAEEAAIDESPIKVKKTTKKNPSTSRSTRRKSVDEKTRKGVPSRSRTKSSSSGEVFSFDSISSSSDAVRRRGRPVKVIESSPSLVSPKRSAKAKRTESIRRGPGRQRKGTSISASVQSPGDAFEFPFSNPGAEDSTNRKPGVRRSRNSRVQPLVTSPPSSRKSADKGKAKASDPVKYFSTKELAAAWAIIEEGSGGKMDLPSESQLSRSFIFTSKSGRASKSPILSSLEASARTKRKPGRPRKSQSPSLSSNSSQLSLGSVRDANDVEISELTPTRRRGRSRIDLERPETSPINPSSSENHGQPGKDNFIEVRHRKPKKDLSAATSLSEVKKRGRPRKDILTNAVFPKISISSRSRGRPRGSESPKAVVVISSDSLTPERSRRGPRNESSVSSPPETGRRGRPRGSVMTPSFGNVMVTGTDKRRPGRPCEETSPLPTIRNDVVRIKQKRGRSCKDVGLIPLAQPETSTSALSSKMRIHTKSIQVDSSSGESFDFAALDDSDASDENFDQFLVRVAKRGPKSQKVSERRSRKSLGKRHTYDVAPESSLQVWEGNHLRRAMSSLSVTTPTNLPVVIISD